MNFTELKEKIMFATKQAFIEMYEKHGEERIYAFALYSDEGAMTVCPATNTLDYLETEKKKDSDLDDFDMFDETDLKYYKFEPAEWKYEMMGADKLFNEISKQCYDEADKSEENDEFDSYQNQLYNTCIEVLEELKSANFFKQITGNDIFLFFTVTDYEFGKREVKKIIKTLNDNKYNKEYLDWMKTW